MGAIIGYTGLWVVSFLTYLYLQKKKKGQRFRTYLLMATATGFVCMLAGITEQFMKPGQQGISQLERNEAGNGAEEIQLFVDAGDVFSGYSYPVTVEEQKLSEEEAEKAFEEAKQELESVILGENQSPDKISTDLEVPDQLMNGLVEVGCFFEPYDLVDMDGTILWDNLREDSQMVKVTAELACQEREAVHEFYIRLVPQPLEEAEALLVEIGNSIDAENQKQGQEYLKLPEEINGIRLNWYDKEMEIHVKVLLLGAVLMVIQYVYEKEKQEKEEKLRSQKLIQDYPDIVSQLSLLSGAGMTISSAWGKIASEYKKKKGGREDISSAGL